MDLLWPPVFVDGNDRFRLRHIYPRPLNSLRRLHPPPMDIPRERLHQPLVAHPEPVFAALTDVHDIEAELPPIASVPLLKERRVIKSSVPMPDFEDRPLPRMRIVYVPHLEISNRPKNTFF